MTFNEVIQLILDKLVNNFDEVYHSAEIVVTDKEKFPAAIGANEWIDLSPSDQKETVYIRRNGDDEYYGDLGVGSCVVAYKMRTPLRIVYFRDHVDEQNSLIAKLLQSSLIGHTRLRSIIRDKWKLQKDESTGNYNFGPDTAYFAIDIYANWQLQPDTCEDDFCVSIDNPFKKCVTTQS